MTKIQLIEAVASNAKISKVDAKKAIDAIVCVIKDQLKEDDKISLFGLGVFSVMQRSERIGRNPRTGMPVKIPAKKVVKFRPTYEID